MSYKGEFVPHSIPCNYDLCFPLFFSHFLWFYPILQATFDIPLFSLLFRVYSSVTSNITIFNCLPTDTLIFAIPAILSLFIPFYCQHLYRIHFHFTLYHFLPFAYVLYNHNCFTSELLLSISISRSIFSSISIESHIFSGYPFIYLHDSLTV